MQVIITAVGPDNRGLADPIVHYVTSAGANIGEIQMYDHDAEKIFAMLLRVDRPVDGETIADLRPRMNEIGRRKERSIR
ncbi:MAG: purU, partial [Planctomycetaceae bacterium]|nr:purU [Planctomycetaceae bacterium]